MANSITGGVENLLGLDTNAGTSDIQAAIQALQSVGVPNAAQLTLPQLQQYVSAGVLSPSQYQAISENPQAYQQGFQQSYNTTGTDAEKAALQQMTTVAQNGSTPIMQAQLTNALNTANQNAQANRAGITENAQERGVSGGGLEFMSKLLGDQGAATNASSAAVNAAANNAQLALQAMTQGGQLGGQLQGQTNQVAEANAQAAQQIAQYNSQLQSAANQYNTQNANSAQAANLQNAQNISNTNTQNANARTQYNAQVPQTIFSDQMGKAGAEANEYGQAANLAEQQAQQQNQFTGGLLGAGATLGGDYLMGNAINGGKVAGVTGTPSQETGNGAANINGLNQPYSVADTYADPYAQSKAHGGEIAPSGHCYAKGGEVHSHEICMKMGGPVPGEPKIPGPVNTTKNDTVKANLTPKEIVLPNTVTQGPNPVGDAAKFVAGVKGQPMPQGNGKSFADVIKELEANGLELRIGTK